MEKKTERDEKMLSIAALVIIAAFAMPAVGAYLICRKNSNVLTRVIGMALLVIGVVAMMKNGTI